jgi:hypothetical protein
MDAQQRKYFAKRLAEAQTTEQRRQVLTELNGTLENFSMPAKQAEFDQVIKEAQDNSATMKNSGEAQEIVKQILKGSQKG